MKKTDKAKSSKAAHLVLQNSTLFCVLLLLFSFLAIHYSCQDKRNRILSSMKMAVSYAVQEYDSIVSNFWQAYMPVYETREEDGMLIRKYFTTAEPFSPQDKNKLSSLLKKMTLRDNRISWIVLYSESRQENYIQQANGASVQPLTSDFPWLEDLSGKERQMEIYGMHQLSPGVKDSDTFAVCGGVPFGYNGSIIIGYHTGSFSRAANFFPENTDSMDCYVLSAGQVVWHSADNYNPAALIQPSESLEGIYQADGFSYYTLAAPSGNSSSYVVCTVRYSDMLGAIHRDTPLLVFLVIAFFGFSVFIGRSVSKKVALETSVIQKGLSILAENKLDYRLPTNFRQSGFPEIARDINIMSSRLNESIQQAYYFELKQKDAQMAELQATFHPHFLYNTLEMLRNKSYGNGDAETAELIANLASIFRGFIGAKTFVSFREELAFSKKYLSLLVARYGDLVSFHYDIDTALLRYGIIRNVLQLLIENYFVHGFDSGRTDNEIIFSGTFPDEDNILLQVKDNGLGMTDAEIISLNREIEQPLRHDQNHFGLKNLNQRLKLFYGPEYGLHIDKNETGGITVSVKIRKMTVADYEKSKSEIF